jgi:hypothetical protein
LQASVNKNRSEMDYRQFFAGGLTPVLESPRAVKISLVRTIEGLLVAGRGPKEVSTWAASLAVHREDLEKAAAGYDAARVAQRTARASEVAARERWRRAYRALYGELIRRYPGDRQRGESYFRPGLESARPAEPEPKPEAGTSAGALRAADAA